MDGHVSCSIVDKVADKNSNQTSDDTKERSGAAQAGLTAHPECKNASFRFTANSSVFKARRKGSKSPTDEDILDGQSDRKERRFKKPWAYCKNDDKNHSKKDKKSCLCKSCCCCCERGKKPGCCCHCCKKTPPCTRKDDREKGESEKTHERDSRRRESRSRDRVDERGRRRGWDRDSDVDSDKSKESFDSSDSISERKSTKDRHHDHSRECLRESFREGRHEHQGEFWLEPTRERELHQSPRELHQPPRELHREASRESRRELLREPSRESRREPTRDHLREPSRRHELLREPSRDYQREVARESPRDPSRDYRREPPREYRHEPPEHHHEPTTEYRHDPSRDYRREPNRESRRESPREFRREPSRECRREPSPECRHDTSGDSRREPPSGRELTREPSHESHWGRSRERPSCEYHHSSRRSSSCHCKSPCCKCRTKSSKESESQPRRSCSGNRPSICSIRSSNCLPFTQSPSQAAPIEPSRTNSYVLIKCVPCTIQQSTADLTHKQSNKGGSYQRPPASPQRQLQIQSLVPPTLLPPPPPLTLNRNPAAGQGLSLGPSYVPLNDSNLSRTQPALSLAPQQTVQLPLGRQLPSAGPPASLGLCSPKAGGQFSASVSPSRAQISSNGRQPSCGQLTSGTQSSPSAQLLPSGGQVGSSGQFSSGQLPSGGQCSPVVQSSLGGQYYSGNQSSSGALYPTNNQSSQSGQSASPGYPVAPQQPSPTVQYVSTERTTPCGQFLSADQNPSYPQQQSSSAHLQSSSAVSLQQHSPYSTPHAGHRENHQHTTTNSDTQSYTPHPYQTLVMCTPCSPSCCSPQSPCGSRPCSSYNQFPPCGPQRACCTTHQVCEPCIPQPELRRHPHAHCRHPADFRGQPPEYRCPVSCTVRVAGCRLRTIHPYLTRPPCVVYSPSSCPCQSSKRFTDHCGAHHRATHARYADDTVIGATYVHPDLQTNESASRHRHNAERTYAGHYYRTAHCRHQIVDNVISDSNTTSRKQQPSPPPVARTRAPRDTYSSCDPVEVDTAPVTRPSSAS